MSGRLEASAVLGQLVAPENLQARRWAVGVMIGLQAVTAAAGGDLAARASHEITPVVAVQPPSQAHHGGASHHHHHKQRHKVAPVDILTPTPSSIPSHIAAPQPSSKHQLHHRASRLSVTPASRAHLRVAEPLIFADISWPQGNCAAIIPQGVEAGRIGINGGNNFTRNGCLDEEVAKFVGRPLSLYVNSGFPGKQYALHHAKNALPHQPSILELCRNSLNARCVARAWGYRAGLFDIRRMVNHNVYQPNIAIDVENQIPAWSKNRRANIASLKGEMAGLRAGAARDGLPADQLELYYAPALWSEITGDWRTPTPVWMAGLDNRKEATAACLNKDPVYNTREHSGGPIVAVQYVVYHLLIRLGRHNVIDEDLDLNVTCPQPVQ